MLRILVLRTLVLKTFELKIPALKPLPQVVLRLMHQLQLPSIYPLRHLSLAFLDSR